MDCKTVAKVLIAATALLFIANSASAGWAFGYYSDNWYVEAFYDGGWHATLEPYNYYYDGWYYFDAPYRYWYGGAYYDYEPGWYYGNRYWYNDPYDYYYHPPDYYYWNGYWSYYPGWAGVYAPVYYGPAHGYGQGSYTGYDYKYPQEADCAEISASAADVSIAAGERTGLSVWVDNYSKRDFSIKSASIYIDGFDVRETGTSYGSKVAGGGSGEITARLEASANAGSGTIKGNVKISGEFTDGTYCSYSDIGVREFSIYVSGKESGKKAPAENSSIGWSTSTAHYEASGNTWKDVGSGEYRQEDIPEGKQGGIPGGEGEQEMHYEYTGNCSALGFGSGGSIRVEAGESSYEDFYIKNYSAVNFYIDGVSAEENSTAFDASGYRKDVLVPAGGMARAGIWVYASDAQEDDYGTATLAARGHFSSGISCEIESEPIYVYVKGKEGRLDFSAFEMEVPGNAEIAGEVGYFTITIDNPLGKGAEIAVEGRGVEVSPTSIYVPPETLMEKRIRVSGLEGGEGAEGFVFFRAGMEGAEFAEKYTKVLKGSGFAGNSGMGWTGGSGEKHDENAETNSSGMDGSGSGAGSAGSGGGTGAGDAEGAGWGMMIGTSIVGLADNAVNMGLSILILAMVYVVYRVVSGKKVIRARA